MRLLFCSEFYFPSIGGVQEVMRQLAERMVQRGHEVTVATSRLKDRTSYVLNGVHIEEFGIKGNAVHGMAGEVERYREYVLNAGFDAILIKAAQQWTFDALWPVIDQIKTRKVFVPCGFSGLYEPAYTDYFKALPDILRSFDHLIFFANKYRDIDFARKHGIENFSIIPNGASEIEFAKDRDDAFRQRYNIPEDSFIFLTVGSLTGLKGHLELTKAFLRLNSGKRNAFLILNGNNPEVPAIVTPSKNDNHDSDKVDYQSGETKQKGLVTDFVKAVGRYPGIVWEAFSSNGWRGLLNLIGVVVQRRFPILFPVLEKTFLLRFLDNPLDHLVSRINSNNKYKRILLINFPRDELIQAYKNANLFVFASNVEYSPLVLFESAAAGLPFLTVPVGNSTEIAEWTGCGIVCPADVDGKGYTRVNPKILAKRMHELMTQPDLLKKLGRIGHERWEEKFSWAKIVVLYEKILAGL